MKVGTDGVMLGAWTPLPPVCRSIWDVGSGSGLIALMLAQRHGIADIQAIEIDSDAFGEMSQNLAASPWAERLHPVEGDICTMAGHLPPPDLIVSNPPFFANALAAPDAARNAARHEATLSFDSLIDIASRCLTPEGTLAMVSPADRREDIEWSAAVRRMNIARRTDIATVEGRQPSRTLWLLTRRDLPTIIDLQAIRTADGLYTPWYRTLTEDFYTHLK